MHALPSAAVIFDLDATLADSQGVAVEAFSAAYAACGLPGLAPASQFIAMSGVPLGDVCVALGLPSSFAEEYRTAARAKQSGVKLFEGVQDLLTRLHTLGVVMGIITGKDRPRTLETIDQLGLSQYFDAVVTPDDPPAPKPSPEGVVALCDALQVTPVQTLVVGDSTLDILAGVRAGSTAIGCTWGVASEKQLLEAGASCTHDTVDELADCLLERVTAS